VPVELVTEMDEVTRTAWYIMVTEQDGAVFDWNQNRFLTAKEAAERGSRD
jgi:hypothetical protein